MSPSDPVPANDHDFYAEGRAARRAGRDETANPYPEGTVEWAGWLDGWANGAPAPGEADVGAADA